MSTGRQAAGMAVEESIRSLLLLMPRVVGRAKKMRVSGDLSLGSIGVDGKKWENDVQGLQDIFRGAQPGFRTFTEDDVKETTDKELKGLRVRMGGLKLYEKWAPNGTSWSIPSVSPPRFSLIPY